MKRKLFATFFAVALIANMISIPVMAVENHKVDTVTVSDNAEEEYRFDAEDFITADKAAYVGNCYEEKALVCGESGCGVTYDIAVSEDGYYNFEVTYGFLEEYDGEGLIKIIIDDDVSKAYNAALERSYVNDGVFRKDGFGNQFAPSQKERKCFLTKRVDDNSGFNSKPIEFYLEKGNHKVKVVSLNAVLAFKEFSFVKPYESFTYEEILKLYEQEKYSKYKGDNIIIEGENAIIKNSNMLVPLSDSSVDVHPSSSKVSLMNYIGSSNWSSSGSMLTWEVDVKESALYEMVLAYRQNIKSGGISFRRLLIDGKPFSKETDTLLFTYKRNWGEYSPLDTNGNEMLIYLGKGKHQISLEVTLGEISEYAEKIQKLNEELGSLYREITKITGETPDANRDYELFKQIPDFNDKLKKMQKELLEIATALEKMASADGNSMISTIKSMATSLELMYKNKYRAHRYISNYYSNYCSMCSGLYGMVEMPLDIDRIYLTAPEAEFEKQTANFFEKLVFSVKKLIISFATDYTSVSKASDYDNESITIWVNWGRDQAQVLNSLISTYFTPEHNINVDVRLTNATMIQGILSGNGPDCALHMERTQPVNLALRGGLYDLSQFIDYEEVLDRFMTNASIPYEYKGGVYALPDTQIFYMMFCRTDIFEEYGIAPPKTWDDFDDVTRILLRNNMQVAIGAGNNINGDLTSFATLMLQNGGAFYNEDKTATNLTSAVAVKTFEKWCNYYTEYKIPVTSDFYNRFRTGVMPIGIQPYTLYSTLSVAAPEIEGKWQMYEIPGVIDKEGNINNVQVSSGTGCAILNNSSNKDAAWEFLKWWTEADTQYLYSSNVESILGIAGRVPTATVDAMTRFSWDKSTKENLLKQWKNVRDLEEVPGGYYLQRAIGQAFWNVVNAGSGTKETINKWGKIANDEIDRKIKEYSK